MPFGVRTSCIACCLACCPFKSRRERTPVMKKLCGLILGCAMLIFAMLLPGSTGTRIKELASLEGVRDNQLIGYGLVVGLSGTGDKAQTVFSLQTLTNMLRRMGVVVDPTQISVRNIAAV